jgi:hypothetical protein
VQCVPWVRSACRFGMSAAAEEGVPPAAAAGAADGAVTATTTGEPEPQDDAMACQGFEPKGRGGLRTWCRGCGQHLDSHSTAVVAAPPRPATPAPAPALPHQSDTAARPDAALLAQKEASLIASYEHLYRQMVATSSAAVLGFDALERAVAAHNDAVRCYDKEMTALNRERLAELAGGWGRLLRVGGGAAAGCGGMRVSDLGEQVRAAHQSVGNNSSNPGKRGADRIFATATGGLVSAAEAGELRRAIDLVGFRPFIRTLPEATTGLSKREPRRTHTALVLHDEALAAWLWPRVEPLVRDFEPTYNYQRWQARCINPCFRCLRYGEGQVFETHTDDVYSNAAVTYRSFLTVVIYCNEGFEGGELRFVKTRGRGGAAEVVVGSENVEGSDSGRVLATVVPAAGLTMVFDHELLHEALPPIGDTPKYIIRTDVIFALHKK